MRIANKAPRRAQPWLTRLLCVGAWSATLWASACGPGLEPPGFSARESDAPVADTDDSVTPVGNQAGSGVSGGGAAGTGGQPATTTPDAGAPDEDAGTDTEN